MKWEFNYIKLFSALYGKIKIFKSIESFRQKRNCSVFHIFCDFMQTVTVVGVFSIKKSL